ncbi:MAG: PEP-CTERM sorting domain-containing protein [Alteraurantiacibacter sp.]
MIKKSLIAMALGTAAFAATPASATYSWWGGSSGGHTHYPGCGHTGTTTSSTSSSSTSSTSSSTSSTTGGSTSTTSGTQVPEPGMLGMFGLGLAGIAFGRRRMRRSAR